MLDEDKSEFSKMENEEADTDVEDQVSISPTSDEQILHTPILKAQLSSCQSFCSFGIFVAVRRTLMKLNPG